MDAIVALFGFDHADLSDGSDFDDMAHAFAAEQATGDDVASTAVYTPTGAFAVYPHAGAFGTYPPAGPFAAYPAAGAIPAGTFAPVPSQAAAATTVGVDDPVDEDPKNPWMVVASRKVRRVRRAAPDPELYPQALPEEVSLVEVPSGVKTGSRRDVRKYRQSQRSGYVSTPEGPGYYLRVLWTTFSRILGHGCVLQYFQGLDVFSSGND